MTGDVAAPACGARSGCSPRRSAATPVACNTRRTSATRAGSRVGAGRAGRDRLRRRLARASGVHRGQRRAHPRAREAARRTSARRARLVFTAHSIPVVDGGRYPYEAKLRASAALIAGAGQRRLDARLPEPQRTARGSVARARRLRLSARGAERRPRGGDPLPGRLPLRSHRSAVRSRRRGREVCREIGIPMARARTVNVHPRFIDALAERSRRLRRYESGTPLAVAPAPVTGQSPASAKATAVRRSAERRRKTGPACNGCGFERTRPACLLIT